MFDGVGWGGLGWDVIAVGFHDYLSEEHMCLW